MNILLIEDDDDTAGHIVDGLTGLGHVVERVADGAEGARRAIAGGFDLLIVDRMLPGLDGLAAIREARRAGVAAPALMLTALGGVDDRVSGLEAGADDYLVKPFAFAELVARIGALARRPALGAQKTRLVVGDLEMDLLQRTVTRAGRDIELQPREFGLLEYLMKNAGRVVTRKMLLENVWEYHFDPKTNIVETHMSRLRAKVDKGFETELIVTLRGAGYVLREPV